MKITVVGTGYVGLVAGACFAEFGNDVLCLDVDPKKIAELKKGDVPIFEPGLAELIRKNSDAGRLHFTTSIEDSVTHGDVQFLAVGTPTSDDGAADLRYVTLASKNIGRYAAHDLVIVNKSTVPVGTSERVEAVVRGELDKRFINVEINVVSNPEFLKEGSAIDDFMRPDRIIIGSSSEKATQILRRLYAPINRYRDRILVMDTRSAELTKYAANTMLATRISLMNELANLSEKLGTDIENVRQGIGADSRIGYHFLYAGCGYGGSCFPKDIRALQNTADEYGLQLSILEAVEKVNRAQKQSILDKIQNRFGEQLDGKQFSIWGLSFKPNTDDMREAPSRVVIKGLLSRGAKILAYDPVALGEAKEIYKNEAKVEFSDHPIKVLDGSEALIILTEWKAFRSPDFAAVKEKLINPVIFDGRNLYSPEDMQNNGFEYISVGRLSTRSDFDASDIKSHSL